MSTAIFLKRAVWNAGVALGCLAGMVAQAQGQAQAPSIRHSIRERTQELASDAEFLRPFTRETAGRISGFDFAAMLSVHRREFIGDRHRAFAMVLAPDWTQEQIAAHLADAQLRPALIEAAAIRVTVQEWGFVLAGMIARLEFSLARRFSLPIELVREESDFIRSPETFRERQPEAPRRRRQFAPLGLAFMDAYLDGLSRNLPEAADALERRVHADIVEFNVLLPSAPQGVGWRMAYVDRRTLPARAFPVARLAELRWARQNLGHEPFFTAASFETDVAPRCRAFGAL